MDITLSQTVKDLLSAFLLLILPLIIIVLGLIVDIESVIGGPWVAWYYILSITWFGSGIIFFGALH